MNTVRFLRNAFLSPLLPVFVVGSAMGSLALFSGSSHEAARQDAGEQGIEAAVVPASYRPAEVDIAELLGMIPKPAEPEPAVETVQKEPEVQLPAKGSPRHEAVSYTHLTLPTIRNV